MPPVFNSIAEFYRLRLPPPKPGPERMSAETLASFGIADDEIATLQAEGVAGR